MVKISIIVPVYKVEKYINKCVDSILSQSLKELELILVDDGSPDNCPAICDQYAKIDTRVKVIHQENAGVSSARNTGLYIAKGEFIGFVDADDYVASDMFEKLYDNAISYHTSIACCNLNFVDENGGVEYSNDEGCDVITNEEMFKIMFDTTAFLRMGVWNKIYKREILNGVYFDSTQHMSEDLLFLLKVVFKTDKIVYLKEGLYFYFRQRQGAATSKPYGLFEKERVKNTHYMSYFIKKHYPNTFPQAVSYKCINGDLTAINKMIDANIKDKEMIRIVKKDLNHSMLILLKCGISHKKMMQIFLCSKSFHMYKLLYKIMK